MCYTLQAAGLFLSTPSARRATLWLTRRYNHGAISIHALREEGDHEPDELPGGFFISIHALREEGDRCFACCGYIIAYFYPRPPRGGRHTGGGAGV